MLWPAQGCYRSSTEWTPLCRYITFGRTKSRLKSSQSRYNESETRKWNGTPFALIKHLDPTKTRKQYPKYDATKFQNAPYFQWSMEYGNLIRFQTKSRNGHTRFLFPRLLFPCLMFTLTLNASPFYFPLPTWPIVPLATQTIIKTPLLISS